MKNDGGEKQVNRRDFIKIAGLGAGAMAIVGGLATDVKAEVPKKWDKATDVVVVGAGYAGLAAAIEAKDAGAQVILLEKMPTIGGNSVIAGGIYNAVDPARQVPLGIKDSVDLHYQQTLAGGDFRADPVKVRYYAEHALEGWTWLEKLGVELARIYQVYGALHPRSHSPKYKGKVAGGAIIAAEYDAVKARKIPLMMSTR